MTERSRARAGIKRKWWRWWTVRIHRFWYKWWCMWWIRVLYRRRIRIIIIIWILGKVNERIGMVFFFWVRLWLKHVWFYSYKRYQVLWKLWVFWVIAAMDLRESAGVAVPWRTTKSKSFSFGFYQQCHHNNHQLHTDNSN